MKLTRLSIPSNQYQTPNAALRMSVEMKSRERIKETPRHIRNINRYGRTTMACKAANMSDMKTSMLYTSSADEWVVTFQIRDTCIAIMNIVRLLTT